MTSWRQFISRKWYAGQELYFLINPALCSGNYISCAAKHSQTKSSASSKETLVRAINFLLKTTYFNVHRQQTSTRLTTVAVHWSPNSISPQVSSIRRKPAPATCLLPLQIATICQLFVAGMDLRVQRKSRQWSSRNIQDCDIVVSSVDYVG